MKTNELDEMQVGKRNRIAQQTLMMLCYLLLLDVVLYGFDVRWLSYPVNVMVLLIVSLFVYMVRIIAAGALAGPSPSGRPAVRLALLAAGSCLLAAPTVMLITLRGRVGMLSDRIGALALFITSGVFLVVTFVMMFIRGRVDRE